MPDTSSTQVDVTQLEQHLLAHDGAASPDLLAAMLDASEEDVLDTLQTMERWGVVEQVEDDLWDLTDRKEREGTLQFEERASDMPCPLGCGYRPVTGADAARHLLAHVFGSHTTGEEQWSERQRYAK